MGSPHKVQCGMTLAKTEFSLANSQTAKSPSYATTMQRECGPSFCKLQEYIRSLKPAAYRWQNSHISSQDVEYNILKPIPQQHFRPSLFVIPQ